MEADFERMFAAVKRPAVQGLSELATVLQLCLLGLTSHDFVTRV